MAENAYVTARAFQDKSTESKHSTSQISMEIRVRCDWRPKSQGYAIRYWITYPAASGRGVPPSRADSRLRSQRPGHTALEHLPSCQ